MINVTSNAIKKIHDIIASKDQTGLMMRIKIDSGGCSGFQYSFSLDDTLTPDDQVFKQTDDVTIIVDESSLALIEGCEVDYVEDLIGAAFKINNPNAASGCGCGSSFSV